MSRFQKKYHLDYVEYHGVRYWLVSSAIVGMSKYRMYICYLKLWDNEYRYCWAMSFIAQNCNESRWLVPGTWVE